MGIAERKERHREQLRQEILEAARELFAEEGYEHVSMRKIADKIEYSPTTIYLYFKDKDDLLQQICEETFGRLIQRIQRAVQSADGPIEGLRAGCRAYIEFGVAFPHHYRMVFLHPAYSEREDLEHFENSKGGQAFQLLEQAIQDCISAGALRKTAVRETATSFWAMLHGITMLLLSGKQLMWITKDRLIERSLDLMIDGLRP